jgi:hypothetical protein
MLLLSLIIGCANRCDAGCAKKIPHGPTGGAREGKFAPLERLSGIAAEP